MITKSAVKASDFFKPSRSGVARKTVNQTQYSTPIQNRFEELGKKSSKTNPSDCVSDADATSEDEENNADVSHKPASDAETSDQRARAAGGVDRKGMTKRSAKEKSSEPNTKLERVPPIIVTSSVTSIRTICDLFCKGAYTIRHTAVGQKIQVNSMETYIRVKGALKHNGAEHFTHELQNERTYKLIAKGLPTMDTNEMSDAIFERYEIRPVKITLLAKAGVRINHHSRVYLFEFNKAQTKEVNLKKMIRRVDVFVPKWEDYTQKPRPPTKCNRCLLYGHGAKNCSRKVVCQWCASTDHMIEKCPYHIVADDGFAVGEPTCPSCTFFGRKNVHHNHNEDTCPSRKAYEALIEQKKKPMANAKKNGFDASNRESYPDINNRNERHQDNKSQYQNKNSYADIIRGTTSNSANNRRGHDHTEDHLNKSKNQGQPHSPGGWEDEKDPLSITEIQEIIQDVYSGLKKCRTQEQQIHTIISITAKWIKYNNTSP